MAAQDFPARTGFVTDAANVLPQATRDDLTRKLGQLKADTGRQLVVATIPDLHGEPIADYGYKLGRAWGIGLKGADNGAVLLIAPNEPKGQRGPRIEVGYGLEPVLTDAMSFTIINERMMPLLARTNPDVPGAIEAGTDAVIAQLRLPDAEARAKAEAAAKPYDQAHRRRASHGGGGIGLIFWAVILLFIVLPMLGRRRSGAGQAWGGGGSNWPVILWGMADAMGRESRGGGWGGGFGGGEGGNGGDSGGWFSSDSGSGGGSFGGGGASGSW